MIKQWFKSGSPWIWLNAAAVSISLILVIGILLLVAVRGLGHFWPADVVEYRYQNNGKQQTIMMGEVVDHSIMTASQAKESGYTLKDNNAEYLVQQLVKTGNRDLTGMDFRWIQQQNILETLYPKELIAVERREWGNFYGRLVSVKENGKVIKSKHGKYLRHPFSGVGLCFKYNIPDEVMHLIAVHSHEGDKFGRSPEAIILNHADFIDFDLVKYH